MSGEHIQHRGLGGACPCEFERTLRGEYCLEDGEVGRDGLTLCERHADRLQQEARVIYWRAILAHVELWSGEARRRSREDVVRLLEIERARVLAELERAKEDENVHRGEDASGEGRAPPLWKPLFLLGGAVIG